MILGNHEDRETQGGVAARIAETVAVLRKCRPLAEDAGIRIAVENHAGDMTSRELAGLVAEAGPAGLTCRHRPIGYAGVAVGARPGRRGERTR